MPLGSGNEAIEEEQEKQLQENYNNPDLMKKSIILVRYDGREAKLLTDKRAPYGSAWLKINDDGAEVEALASEITFIAVIEA